MRAVIQRVNSATLKVDEKLISKIDNGMVVYLGIGKGDSEKELKWLAKKVSGLRIFSDDNGKMNLGVKDCNFEILAVSQFTLYGEVKSGYRPGFSNAEEPVKAKKMYEDFCKQLRDLGVKKVAEGIFGADMTISQENNGPVTIIIDTEKP
jgi:D-tyrosyl-tRNA(Tyr) deacylase